MANDLDVQKHDSIRVKPELDLVQVIEETQTRIDDAIKIAWRYAQIGGDHHHLWVIDQMLRKLLPGHQYTTFVEKYEDPDEVPGPFEWDVGIAP